MLRISEHSFRSRSGIFPGGQKIEMTSSSALKLWHMPSLDFHQIVKFPARPSIDAGSPHKTDDVEKVFCPAAPRHATPIMASAASIARANTRDLMMVMAHPMALRQDMEVREQWSASH